MRSRWPFARRPSLGWCMPFESSRRPRHDVGTLPLFAFPLFAFGWNQRVPQQLSNLNAVNVGPAVTGLAITQELTIPDPAEQGGPRNPVALHRFIQRHVFSHWRREFRAPDATLNCSTNDTLATLGTGATLLLRPRQARRGESKRGGFGEGASPMRRVIPVKALKQLRIEPVDGMIYGWFRCLTCRVVFYASLAPKKSQRRFRRDTWWLCPARRCNAKAAEGMSVPA
jgi:hypothetical protein